MEQFVSVIPCFLTGDKCLLPYIGYLASDMGQENIYDYSSWTHAWIASTYYQMQRRDKWQNIHQYPIVSGVKSFTEYLLLQGDITDLKWYHYWVGH